MNLRHMLVEELDELINYFCMVQPIIGNTVLLKKT